MPLREVPDVLLFDCFGTVFDWRSSITSTLESALGDSSLSDAINDTSKIADLAQEWRNSYKKFCYDSSENPSLSQEFVTIDSHHFTSLVDLLNNKGISSQSFEEEHLWRISQTWHFLRTWDDSVDGMAALKKLCTCSSLSNGNVNLLVDLSKSSGVAFDVLMSSELFHIYKPNPKVYTGACALLGYGPSEETKSKKDPAAKRTKDIGRCAMVAAHLDDLKAAKECGLKIIYVWREGEEDWSQEEVEAAKASGMVDLWIEKGGFLELARKLGEIKR